MTKKTNSLLLRYGSSVLWKKKTSSVNVLTNYLQSDKLINVWLKKKGLILVTIQYGLGRLELFVYKKLFLEDRLKNKVIKFYKKTLQDYNALQKFGIKKNQLEYILSETLFNKLNVRTIKLNTNFFYSMKHLRYKKGFLLLILLLNRRLSLSSVKIVGFYFSKLLFFFIKPAIFSDTKIKTPLIKGLGLRKVNGFLKFKLISKGLENLLFKLQLKKTQINIKNMYLIKSCFRVPFFGKPVVKPEFRFKFFTLFLAVAYQSSFLLAEHIVDVINKGKQHRRNLQVFISLLERILNPRLVLISGFQLRVSGKLGGKLRKSKYHYKIGKVKLQTLRYSLSYSLAISYTRFGVFSIKVWLVK